MSFFSLLVPTNLSQYLHASNSPLVKPITSFNALFNLMQHLTACSAAFVLAFIAASPAFAQLTGNQADTARTSTLQEVIVTGNSLHNKVHSTQMGMETISAIEAKNLPAILGEVDIIKVLQLKPGVKNAGEGMAGFYVRGGGADQNLITLDGIPIYNANHLLGLFSIFNNDAVEDAKLFKAAYPAKYGGRLSSVLDVSSRKGSMDSMSINGGIGLLSSRLSVETPIKKGSSSIIVSARRTYLDLIINTINNINKDKQDYEKIPSYLFSEINIRSDWKINRNNTAWTTMYLGGDDFKLDAKDFPSKFRWGNKAFAFNWRSFTKQTIFTSSIFYSGYKYTLENRYDDNDIEIQSAINTIGLNINANRTISEFIKIQAGLNIMHHQMKIGDYKYSSSVGDVQAGERTSSTEFAGHLGSEWNNYNNLAVSAGVRLSGFNTGERVYINPEPRIGARYNLNENSSLKLSYTRMYQYLHLASLSAVSLPVDIWYPSTQRTKPQFADQLSLGYSRSIGELFFLNLEGYYKWMYNQVEFRDGANLVGNPKIENDFVYGKANAYGAEAYMEKKIGRTRGWFGYTLAWATRTFADINEGKSFKPRYDRRHDISLVVMHKLNNMFSFSFNWTYGSGAYTTLPVGRYIYQNESGTSARSVVPIYESRNNYQLQPVHRLDINFVTTLRSKKGRQDITFSLYNVYSRRNPFYMQFKEVTDKEGYITSFLPKVVSLFPVLPGITYNFKF